MRNLSTLTNQEFQNFLNSFDVILSDVDGVVWNLCASIPGATDAVRSLHKLGKKIIFVTNNTTKRMDFLSKQLKDAGFDIDTNNIITPIDSIISFLKTRDMTNKQIFVIGMDPLKEKLEQAGFELIENGPDRIENIPEFIKITVADDGIVGAVIADIDVNLNFVNLQKGITFLERPEVLFLKGATDVRFQTGLNKILMGPGIFSNIMEEMAGRKAIPLAKPSKHLNECIIEKYGINDKSRVLFMGDSIPEDMGFGTNCGYAKLLVLSGLSKKEDLENWKYPEEFKPDFYADSLKVIFDSILRVYGSDF